MLKKRAIALLITVFFIMAISVSLGIALKYVATGSKSMQSEQFTLQTSMILEDVLKILQGSPELAQVNSQEGLAIFLAESSIIPFQSNGMRILIEIKSARAKINPNVFTDTTRLNIFKSFLIKKMINTQYADILADAVGGIKEDMSYNTDVFTHKPSLFRDYVTSDKHLEEFNDSFMRSYEDESLKNIEMQELFYTSKESNSSIDLNYATPLVWEVLLGCDEERAQMLQLSGGTYASVEDLGLSSDENSSLSHFKTSFFEPHIEVNIAITEKNISSNLRFEYNIQSKKGSNFVYEI